MAKKNGRVCVLFSETPPGTAYKKNHYVWVSDEKAEGFISNGYGEEYDPKKKKAVAKKETDSSKSSGSSKSSKKKSK